MVSIAAMSLLVIFNLHPFLEIHNQLCSRIFDLTGIHSQTSILTVLPQISAVHVTSEAGNSGQSGARWISFLVVFGALTAVAFMNPMLRAFSFFVSGLLIVSGVLALVKPDFAVPPEAFALLWLRTQIALWVLLPCLVSLLVVPIEPSLIRGVASCLLISVYAIVWSAVRLVLCLTVIQSTGILFVTTLWFALGPLSDLVYILFFYSIVVRQASIRLWRNAK